MSLIALGTVHESTLIPKWSLVPSKGQNLKPFACYGDVSIREKILDWGVKPQTNIKSNEIYSLNFKIVIMKKDPSTFLLIE